MSHTVTPAVRARRMPKRDAIHETVVRALESAGWIVTHDPFSLPWQDQLLYDDLAVEQPHLGDFLAAESDARRIAVEIKSFLRDSAATVLEQAVGQYVVYHPILRRTDPGRTLFLAVSELTQWIEHANTDKH